MSAETDLQEVLARLRTRFASESLPLAGQLRACLARQDTAAAAELRPIAHKLAGSAGVFGFDGIGATAAQLDELLGDAAGLTEAARHVAETLAAQLNGLKVTST
jgi:HPt (histidine-containing phosphotransfer) domain-containing protein